jgi:hypothetical protein
MAPPGTAASCDLLTTRTSWRTWCARLGAAANVPPDAFVDFRHDDVLTVVAAVGPEGITTAVAEEEGVDVVTLTAEALPAAAAGRMWFVCVVPRRPAQLAVVLRRERRGEPVDETTLRVFAGR